MIVGVAVQQPADRLDYDVKYDTWFGAQAETLSNVVVSLTPNDTTVSAVASITDTETIKVWIQGGVDSDDVTVELTATMASGRIKQDEILVRIRDFV